MAKVTMPQLGESVAEGTIGKWLKQPGDHVDKYEPLVEVVTDKVNAEVPSPFEGILREILVEEGATVPNNAEIAVIETADDGADSAAAGATGAGRDVEPAPAAPAAAAPTAAVAAIREPRPRPPPVLPAATNAARPSLPRRHRLHPPDRRRPHPHRPRRSPPATSTATASRRPRDGRSRRPDDTGRPPAPARARPVTGPDPSARAVVAGSPAKTSSRWSKSIRTGTPAPAVPAAAAETGATNGSAQPAAAPTASPAATAPAAPAPASPAPVGPAGSSIVFPPGADEVLLPMTQMRKGIAAQMTRALAVPHAYVHMEVDATALVRARETAKRDYQAREGISLSYVPFVIKAAVDALRQAPAFNAHWTDAGLVAKRRIHMGVAVAVDDGLLVPVVRDVDQLSISGLNRAIAEVAARARAGKLRLEDYGGSTFTIDNTGWFGSNLTMPIINVPEVAILTMEAITKRAVVRETPEGDVIAIRPVMNMVLASTIAPTTAHRRPRSCGSSRPGSRGSDPKRRSSDRVDTVVTRTVFVTGAAGFIGLQVARQLRDRGDWSSRSSATRRPPPSCRRPARGSSRATSAPWTRSGRR